MRDRMERFVLLPFAVGCMSESSVGVASSPQSRRPSNCPSPPSLHPTLTRDEETERHGCAEEETLSADECSKSSSWSSLALPKPNLSVGMDRLFKGFKTFSNLFVYKEEEEEEEEEEEMEIEIGVPTDVKHVTHIGWDGCAGVANYPIIKGGRNKWPDTLDFLNNNNNNNNNERALQLLSKFNDHHQQLPHPSSSSSAASIVQLEGSTPQTDGQDHTKTTTNPDDDHHHLIAADQVCKEIEGGKGSEHNQ